MFSRLIWRNYPPLVMLFHCAFICCFTEKCQAQHAQHHQSKAKTEEIRSVDKYFIERCYLDDNGSNTQYQTKDSGEIYNKTSTGNLFEYYFKLFHVTRSPSYTFNSIRLAIFRNGVIYEQKEMSPHCVEARFSVNNRKEFIGIYYSTQFATIVNDAKQKKKPPSKRIAARLYEITCWRGCSGRWSRQSCNEASC